MSIDRHLRQGLFALTVNLAVLLFARAGQADVVPLTSEQMIQRSHQIVVAVVESQQARWNDQHTLIVTDYRLRVEERLRGEAPDRVVLTMPGGTLGEETHDTSLSVHLHPGDRYLLFCRGLGEAEMAPTVGAWQGVFREIRTADGPSGVAPGDGEALLLEEQGARVSFSDFVSTVRSLARQVPLDAPISPLRGWTETARDLPAKAYSPGASRPDPGDSQPPRLGPASVPATAAGADALGTVMPPADERRADIRSGLVNTAGKYVYTHRANAPVLFNQLPSSFTPWAPHDQAMMAYWNIYASTLFRVYANPTGTWSWGNGVNDIAGFAPDSDMITQFGAGWTPDILAVTYTRSPGGGPIVESDIAFNPHYQWTLDEAAATTPGNPANSFRQAALHELGHTWGLQHPWETQRVWWDSVMNYAPGAFRLTRLLSDDAAAVRAAFPGTYLHDGLLSSYITDFSSGNQATYAASLPLPAIVQAGGTLQMSQPITLENTGTDDLVNPTIEVYLTPQRLSFANALLLNRLHYTVTVHPFPNGSVQGLNIGLLTVPPQTPPGSYAVAFFLRDDNDALQGNNGAWTATFLNVQGGGGPCVQNATTACLLNGRFRATVRYRAAFDDQPVDTDALLKPVSGFANPSYETAFFYFNDPNNIEMMVKMLDQGNTNGSGLPTLAVLFGTATPLRIELTITDTTNQSERHYTSHFMAMTGATDFTAFVK